MSTRIAVFGGTFDPIHIGHLAAVQDAADALGFEHVLFVPNARPPHKTELPVSPSVDRVEMVRLSLEANPAFILSLVEFERDGPSYMLDTMRVLRERYDSDHELYFLAGCDALAELHTWHRPQVLLDEFRVVFMDRPTESELSWPAVEQHFPAIRRQVDIVHVAQLQISGEDIRQRVRTGRSIRYHVVPAVEQYIRQRGLYRT